MWKHKYFIDRKELPTPITLFQDYNGIWAPLGALYWSTSSSVLVSRHPLSCIEEVISQYCPQCCTRFSDEDSIMYQGRCNRCTCCPICRSILIPKHIDQSSLVLACGDCNYTSASCGITDTDRDGLEMQVLAKERENAAGEVFRSIMASYEAKSQVSTTMPRSRSSQITPDIASSSESAATTAAAIDCSAANRSLKFPQRLTLFTKRTVRSRIDQAANKMSILVTPKANPLEGDSGNRQTLNKGKWFAKDLSAVTLFPFVSISKLKWVDEIASTGISCSFDLTLSNPIAEHGVDVLIYQRGTLTTDKVEELENFPAFDISSLFILPCVSLPPSTFDEAISSNLLVSLRLDAFEDEYLRDEGKDSSEANKLVTSAQATDGCWQLVDRQFHASTLRTNMYATSSIPLEVDRSQVVLSLPLYLEVRDSADSSKLVCSGNFQICVPIRKLP